MNVKAWMPLAVAIVLGLIAAKLVRDRMQKAPPPAPADKLVPVVVARGPVEIAHALTEADLTVSRVPPETVPAQSFTRPADVAGRVTLTQLVKGQTITETLLASKETGAGLQALVPPGYRAITVEVNEFSGVAGMLVPGCRVDVISVVKAETGQDSVARTIVQNLKVLAVGRQLSSPTAANPANDEGHPPGQQATAQAPTISNSVTLVAKPEEAQAIQLASAAGRPWLVLRGGGDGEEIDARATSTAELRGQPRELELAARPDDPFAGPPVPATQPAPATQPTTQPTEVAEKPRPKRTITFIRGTQQTSIDIDAEGEDEESDEGKGKQAPSKPADTYISHSDPGPATVR